MHGSWNGSRVDTTVQTKAVAHPTDSHLILRRSNG